MHRKIIFSSVCSKVSDIDIDKHQYLFPALYFEGARVGAIVRQEVRAME